MLLPDQKFAVAKNMKEWPTDASTGMFEQIRRLVREGRSSTGEKAERLGKKEIDGREAVGFRFRNEGGDTTLWADSETARPIRIESRFWNEMTEGCTVMNNFRYDVDLDPSLFSLKPPAGYTMPVEKDLVKALRTIAEHGKGVFPKKLGLNKEVMEPLMAENDPEKMDAIPQDRLAAVMNEVTAKYGGLDKLRAKYGKELPPAIMAEIEKGVAPLIQENTQRWVERQIDRNLSKEKRMRGVTFYATLEPENDPHYVGSGVKMGTPDCPILWYKPTDADKYRVIHADLSVKEMTPDDVKKLLEAEVK